MNVSVVRTSLAAVLMLAAGVASYVPAIRGDGSLATRMAREGDPVTIDDLWFGTLKPFLPARGRIGYLQPADWPDGAAVRSFYRAQYSLAPRIVVPGTAPDFLIVVPDARVRTETASADLRLAGFTLVRRFENGLLLFRRMG